jgi:isopenicillin-N epimerase
MEPANVGRRTLLGGLALAVAGSACAAPPKPADGDAAPPTKPEPDEWERVRSEFAISREWVHLGGFLLASHPRVVREAIEKHRKALDDNPVHYLAENERDGQAQDHVLRSAAAYLGCEASEIALTDSTTMGLAIVYAGLPLQAGDEIVTTTHDHYVTHESLRLAAERTGVIVKKVPLYARPSSATQAGMVEAIARAITKATRVVAVTWVHSSTGVKIPVRGITDAVARANRDRSERERIVVVVDGVHGFGVEDATMADLGCDVFIAGTHKWICGPRGTGIVWARKDFWPRLRPIIPSFGHEAYVAWIRGEAPGATSAAMMTPGGFHSFEHRWALGEAFDFHLGIGKAKVAARIHALNRKLKEGLASISGVTLHTPVASELSSGITCFDVAGMEPDAVVAKLRDKKIIATKTPYKPSCSRAAPGLLTSMADVDATLREVRALTS